MRRKQKKKNKRRKDKKKWKKAKRRLICVDYNAHYTVSNSLIVDDDLVVSQILSRLPLESIIERDSHFINLHHAHSEARPGFFIVVQDHTSGHMSFLSADIRCDGRGANIHTVRKIVSSSSYLKILGPVRGLICLVDIFAVQIYNVSTGEVTPWIKSTIFINLEKQNVIVKVGDRPECYFGFDIITGKHKAIFLWYEGKFKDLPVCEVLAVGDNAWRRIDDAPHVNPMEISTFMPMVSCIGLCTMASRLGDVAVRLSILNP
ncbi:hypothetical protein MKW92_047241 [Papaver armeniacum]|nr:hypothetical protein MKW92_047241 [Papaver armeniacum]